MNCRHFLACGGCSLPGVPYAEQLTRKRTQLSQLLGVPVAAVLPSPRESAFRSKVAFVFGSSPGGRAIVMGHFAAGSNRIVAVEECPVHSERGNRIAFGLRDHLAKRRVHPALLRHVIVRTTADEREAVAMLVVTRNDKSLRAPIRAFLDSADSTDGFFVNVHDRPGPYMIGPETIRIAGRSHVKERTPSGSFLISPTAFFQTNVGAASELQRLVTAGAALTPGSMESAGHVLDLYSGSGLFTIPLALRGARVVAVEENVQAVDDAESNIRLNRVRDGRVRLFRGRAEDVLPRLAGERFDVVVLDPPRQGCAPAVLDTIFRSIAPPRVLYVSCNPEAFAAELPRIIAAGYALAHVQPVDMFPHTDHVELVAALERHGARRS